MNQAFVIGAQSCAAADEQDPHKRHRGPGTKTTVAWTRRFKMHAHGPFLLY